MWGIHDFPAYGNLSRYVTHGYKACPICGDDTTSIQLDHSKKVVYTNYCLFLSMDHPFRSGGGSLGLRSTEHRHLPSWLYGDALMETLRQIKYVSGNILKVLGRKKKSCNEDNSANVEAKKAWYKRSIFFDLKYWSSHQVDMFLM